MSYVKNAWYVAGWSSEFSDALTSITVLEQEIVLFRSSGGDIIALEDRCPHKFLPLSMGQRIGDTIQCGYHGMTFDCNGKCIRVPGQENLPASAFVEKFTVHEKNNIVWIWMGEENLADTDKIFDIPQFYDPAWDAHQGQALQLEANYLNVAENLVDPAHVSFVHPTTLGSAASEDVPVHADTQGEVIVAWRWIKDKQPVGFFQNFGGFKGNVDRWHYYYLHLPSIAVIDFGSADVGAITNEDDRHLGVRIFALHFLTPVSKNHTIDRWMHLRNTSINNDETSNQLDEMFKTAFAEDQEILAAVQRQEDRGISRPSVRIAIDKGPLVYRKRISDLIKKEGAQAHN